MLKKKQFFFRLIALGTRYIYDQNLFNFLIVCNFIIGISDACIQLGDQVVTKLSTSGLPEVYRLLLLLYLQAQML